jgi:hypothetical protein
LAHAYREDHGEEMNVSSDESLVTIPEEEPESLQPTSLEKLKKSLSGLPPKDLKSLFRSVLKKRPRDLSSDEGSGEDSHLQKARRCLASSRAEVPVTPGLPLPPCFNDHHLILVQSRVYTPLTLFTNTNLRLIAREEMTLATTKISIGGKKTGSFKILDLVKFHEEYGAEKNLTHTEWSEASRNYLRFLETLEPDNDDSISRRWDAHFGYFDNREDCIPHFKAILQLDIRMRKEYLAQPFAFSGEFYSAELEKEIREVSKKDRDNEVSELRKLIKDQQALSAGPSYYQKGKFKPFVPTYGDCSFPSSTSFDAHKAACIICAKKGHIFSSCHTTSFSDRKPLFANLENRDIVVAKTKVPICRNWNIRGPSASSCCYDL